jgi:hypothetical protein
VHVRGEQATGVRRLRIVEELGDQLDEHEQLLQRIAREPLGARDRVGHEAILEREKALEQRFGERVLRFEVIEERALGDLHAREDLVDRGRREPLIDDEILRRREDALARRDALVTHLLTYWFVCK